MTICVIYSGGFRGGLSRLRSPTPSFGDGLTPSLAVLVICDNGTVLWRHYRQFYLFKHVNHDTGNIQNDCHQWLLTALESKFVFGPGPTGELTVILQTPSWFKGPPSKRRGVRGTPLSQIPGSAPDS